MVRSRLHLPSYAFLIRSGRHLGHSQWAQTPVGRGFEEHIGSYMWDLDSYTKQQYELPWEPLVVDWVHAHSNGSYEHYAESRHSTEAITQNAVKTIVRHSQQSHEHSQPLFLYVAYTACHSPLQAMPEHEIHCQHIPHLWRRQFCGMIRGLDEGIQNISDAIQTYLGENTLLYLSSDNGGSTWFGGLNTPLRGGKSTPYEGGVRVPAFIVDYTSNQSYLGTSDALSTPREYHGLMHCSDILPTMLAFAGVSEDDLKTEVMNLDGYNFAPYFRSLTQMSPRSEVLLELYNKGECIFKNESMHSYLVGDMKLIEGIVRDPHHHYESRINWMNSTDPTFITSRAQLVIRFLEWIFDQGPFDNSRIVLSHSLYHTKILQPQMDGLEPILRLYNLTADPEERNNIADQHPLIVKEIQQKIQRIIENRPYQQPYWMQYHLTTEWPQTFKSGDCSMNPKLLSSSCRFTHPWIPDDVNPWKDLDQLTDALIYAKGKLLYVKRVALFGFLALALLTTFSLLSYRSTAMKQKKS
jgi:hypothetical protein